MLRRLIGVAVATLLSATPALAHHAFSADFDPAKPIRLDGTITRIEWTNPHAYLYLDVKDAHGKNATNWKVELGGNDDLDGQIWSPKLLKVGSEVTMQGWQAKDGSSFANADSVTIDGGVRLWAASSYHIDSGRTGTLDPGRARTLAPGRTGTLAAIAPEPGGIGTGGVGGIDTLPETASSLWLVGLSGALSFLGALALHRAHR